MEAQFYIEENKTHSNISMLEILLADEIILNIKTRKFYWIVSKDSFHEIHQLFHYQHLMLEKIIDTLGLYIGKSESMTIGTMKEYSQLARIREFPDKDISSINMLENLLSDHAFILKYQYDNIEYDDQNISEGNRLIRDILEKHEIMEWILGVYLKKYSNASLIGE